MTPYTDRCFTIIGRKTIDALLIKAGLITAKVEENKLVKLFKSWFNKEKAFIFRKKSKS